MIWSNTLKIYHPMLFQNTTQKLIMVHICAVLIDIQRRYYGIYFVGEQLFQQNLLCDHAHTPFMWNIYTLACHKILADQILIETRGFPEPWFVRFPRRLLCTNGTLILTMENWVTVFHLVIFQPVDQNFWEVECDRSRVNLFMEINNNFQETISDLSD